MTTHFRISLREMLLLVATVAVAIVSLKYANDLWVALLSGMAMVVLFGMLIVAVVDRGPRQVFAIGFALTVVAYGGLLMTGRTTRSLGSGNVYTQNTELDPYAGRLPTTRLLRFVYKAVNRSEYVAQFPLVQTGQSSQVVEVLQNMLNARVVPSPNLTVDGDFGIQTEAAVVEFQKAASLPMTGVVDVATWTALGPAIDSKSGMFLPAYAPKLPITQMYSLYRERPPREVFMPIGQCWWALILGYAGGWFATFVYSRRIREQAATQH